MIENKQQRPVLIASFSGVSAPAPHTATNHDSRVARFLFGTNKAHKIIILATAPMKTKEKQFSIRYKFASRGTGLPAAAGHMLRCAGRGARITIHKARFTSHDAQRNGCDAQRDWVRLARVGRFGME